MHIKKIFDDEKSIVFIPFNWERSQIIFKNGEKNLENFFYIISQKNLFSFQDLQKFY